ncbi:hypothetical protein OG552_33490 [Streptomyces sp. NBC_01476]|uniref:hypothetical protein n=1 Tax=Streptomyces sp. NBC_01476 TaxID=2903881 RepID=UPI002E351517|nr:hypothetical protein [Streptomyces sp. NBC_01476]
MAISRTTRIAATVAVAAVIGGLGFSTPAFASAPAQQAAAPTAAVAGPATAGARVVSQLIARGRVDGDAWSVTLEFHPTLPGDYPADQFPGSGEQPQAGSLLCRRMYIGGVRIDQQGGPWADCQPVNGAHDPAGSGSAGLWGLHDKGTTGSRLFVSNPENTVAYGVLTLTDGTSLTARTLTVHGTDYRAWAVAIPDGRTIATVDEYDTHHQLVSHSADWR